MTTLAFIGLGRRVSSIKIGDFQGPTVNLLEGNLKKLDKQQIPKRVESSDTKNSHELVLKHVHLLKSHAQSGILTTKNHEFLTA